MKKTYHYIYKITNTKNQKFYIGRHSTDNLNDGYFGSGSYLEIAFDDWGIENFRKEIVCYCSSIEELTSLEKRMIDGNYKAGIKTYNIQLKSGSKKDPYKDDGRRNTTIPVNGWYIVSIKEMKLNNFPRKKTINDYVKWFKTFGYKSKTLDEKYKDKNRHTKIRKQIVVYKSDKDLEDARNFLTRKYTLKN